VGLHEVEQVAEGLRLAEMELGLVYPDVIVHIERNEKKSSTIVLRFRLSGVHASPNGEHEGIGCVGVRR
jgi:hypothetical protein